MTRDRITEHWNEDGTGAIQIHRPKDTGHLVNAELLEGLERELATRLEIAGDTAPTLMYQMADADPEGFNRWIGHHARHFERRMVNGAEQVEVASVLIRHGFLIGFLAGQRSARPQ